MESGTPIMIRVCHKVTNAKLCISDLMRRKLLCKEIEGKPIRSGTPC